MQTRRDRSAALFNNRYFAEVVLAILGRAEDDDFFTTRQIAAQTGLADSLVRPVLLRLCAAAVLERLPRMGGGRSPQHHVVRAAAALGYLGRLADMDHAAPVSEAPPGGHRSSHSSRGRKR